MVIQNISSDKKTTDITFTVKRDEVLNTKRSKTVFEYVIDVIVGQDGQ